MRIQMQIFTHKGENVQFQLRKQPPLSGRAAASGWIEQFKITSNFEVSKVVLCHDNKSLPRARLPPLVDITEDK